MKGIGSHTCSDYFTIDICATCFGMFKIFKYQGIYWPDIAILLVVSAIMFGVSIVTFGRKEIYV